MFKVSNKDNRTMSLTSVKLCCVKILPFLVHSFKDHSSTHSKKSSTAKSENPVPQANPAKLKYVNQNIRFHTQPPPVDLIH